MKQKIYFLIIKILSIILSTKVLNKLELIVQNSLGKGISINIENEVNSLKKFLKDDVNIILDIGANYGIYTDELLKHYPNAKYFLFEPLKEPYQYLANKFKNYPNVKILNNAVSDKNLSSLIYYDKIGTGAASLSKRNLEHFNIVFDKVEKVELISLNTMFKDDFKNKSFKIDFCKIDIEGHEFTVLNSIKDNFERFKIIQFEIGGCNIDSRTYFQDFWYLLKNNFNIYRISPSGPILIKKYRELDETFTMTNYLAVNKN
jgi:FkbM family methyltransferase